MASSSGGQPGAGRPERVSPLWIAHHFPEDYDRCVRVGRTRVCRRCLVLYPVAFAALALTYGRTAPLWLDLVVVAGLPVPAVAEFVAEHGGWLRYDPRRQVAVTVPLAVGLGRGFARYLGDQTDLLFWGVVVIGTAACLVAALTGPWHRGEPRSARPRGPAKAEEGRSSL